MGTASFANLPSELYHTIIAYFEPEDLTSSILSLSRALPLSPVPTYPLFNDIRLKRSEQVLQLYLRLRNAPEDAARVRTFSFECWSVDADVFVNLATLLPSVVQFSLHVGPNFAPEHLEEIFQHPMKELRGLSLRFRPYVQRATYYQFLKGAYFDSTLLALSRWPSQPLPMLSVVQDPLDPAIAPTGFAQPLVFFRLDPLGALGISPIGRGLKHFRLRVPARPVCHHLFSLPRSFLDLEFLDMSTSSVVARDLEGLLGRMPHIQILVLDGCPIVSQRTDVQLDAGEPFQQWMELGRTLALVGKRRATERERKLKTWVENYYVTVNEEPDPALQKGKSGKAKRGRKGLATATISLRAREPERTEGASDVTIPRARIPPRDERVRILPAPPALRSVAAGLPGGGTPEAREAARAEFERGWAEGVAMIVRSRLLSLTSFRNGIARVVRFADRGEPEWEEEGQHGEQGLAGLVDVRQEAAFELDLVGGREEGGGARECPLLCLAGPGRDEEHVEGCGHRLGWSIFKDDT